MSAGEIMPWWSSPWRNLWERRRQGRLPHALLVSGPRGVGKGAFARRLAGALLCENPGNAGDACGVCTGCTLFAAGTHPDFGQMSPVEEGKAIVVDQIRSLCTELGLRSHAGGFKVAVLTPAERLNAAAANSLLKTLEEPSDNTVLMLISERPALLPATIRSRCQQVRLSIPPREVALAWLRERLSAPEQCELLLDLAAGAPLLALQLDGSNALAERSRRFAELVGVFEGRADALGAAAAWAQEKELDSLAWFTGWTMDMIRLKTSRDASGVRSTDLRDDLMGLAKALSAKQLFALLDRLWNARRLAGTTVNRQLLVEEVLIGWARLGSTGDGTQRQVRS